MFIEHSSGNLKTGYNQWKFVGISIGLELTYILLTQLVKMGLPLWDIRGQCELPFFEFVVNDMVKSSLQTVKFLIWFKKYFLVHPLCNGLSFQIDSAKLLRYHVVKIFDALYCIYDD